MQFLNCIMLMKESENTNLSLLMHNVLSYKVTHAFFRSYYYELKLNKNLVAKH